jgi:hypothetical protein
MHNLFRSLLPSSLLLAAAVASPLVSGGRTASAETPVAPPAPAVDVTAALRRAAEAYAAAFNGSDMKALADQWTLHAELDEAGELIEGRDAIVAALSRLRGLHPRATLKVEVTDVQPLGEAIARVRGTLAFAREPGQEPAVSRFQSVRVLEGGRWRIAESQVVPTARAALADLGWLVGRWQTAPNGPGPSVEATYEKILGGHAILGRIKTVRKDGTTVEALDVIQADRRTGRVRCWTLDSTGSHAEGEFTTDGSAFNRSLVAAPGDPAVGDRAEWVQVLTPLGPDLVLWQSIERSLDGRPLPDTAPTHLRRVR